MEAIRKAQQSLKVLKKVEKEIDVDRYVNDTFIRRAAAEFGYDYEARLKDYKPLPFSEPALDTGAPVTEPALAGQVWVRGEAKVRLYSTIVASFAALDQLKAEGKTARVVFVHDRESGNKLFADKVWYRKSDGELAAFLSRSAAEADARKNGGKLLDYEGARGSVRIR